MPKPRRSEGWVSSKFEPFRDNPKLQLSDDHVFAPAKFFNPTRARFDYVDDHVHPPKPSSSQGKKPTSSQSANDVQWAKNVHYKWRSRDNRKGRHTVVIDPTISPADAKFLVPEFSNTFRATMKGIWHMFTYFPVWNVSYLTAQCFFWGSIIFTANGLFYWIPLLAHTDGFSGEGEYAGGITAFVGTVFFQAGVIFLMLEAVNAGRVGCFGFALHEVVSKGDSDDGLTASDGKLRLEPSLHHCIHHQTNTKSLFSTNHKVVSSKTGAVIDPADLTLEAADTEENARLAKDWVWWPSWHDLKTHYFHEIGFLSALIYFASATVFWMIGFCSLPNVEGSLTPALFYAVFWTPDCLGSLGFIIGSYLIMLEVQPNWYTPSLSVLGWHIGFWNTLGSVGFALSAAFGTADQALDKSWLLWQSDCHTTWGSFAFAIAAALQWYESVNKHVVEKLKD